jgi:hypothetical protein
VYFCDISRSLYTLEKSTFLAKARFEQTMFEEVYSP